MPKNQEHYLKKAGRPSSLQSRQPTWFGSTTGTDWHLDPFEAGKDSTSPEGELVRSDKMKPLGYEWGLFLDGLRFRFPPVKEEVRDEA